MSGLIVTLFAQIEARCILISFGTQCAFEPSSSSLARSTISRGFAISLLSFFSWLCLVLPVGRLVCPRLSTTNPPASLAVSSESSS